MVVHAGNESVGVGGRESGRLELAQIFVRVDHGLSHCHVWPWILTGASGLRFASQGSKLIQLEGCRVNWQAYV